MAFNAYLVFHPKTPDIKGESSSHLFDKKGAVEISDYGFAAAMPVTASRSDGGLGKNIEKICLHLFRAGDEGDTGAVKYAMVVFKHCVITKVGISGGGEELPKESLEFNYGICEYHYQQTNHETGKPEGDVRRFGWSTVNNKVHADLESFNA